MVHPRARSAPTAPRRPPGHPDRSGCIAVGAAVDGLLSTRGIWVQDAVREPSLTGTACNRTGATGARQGAPDRRGGTSRLGAERAGERGRAHRPSRSDPWPPGPSPWPMGLRGYHLIRSSMRFRSPQGTTRRAAAAPRRTRTALGEKAALGALEDFAESDPGPATPRRWRRGRGPRPVHAVPGLPAHGAPRRVSPTGAGGAPSTNAIESASDQLRKGDQEPQSLLSSDEAAVELLWPADPQQRRTRPRARQGPGQTRQRTHRPTPSHPRPTYHQLQNKPSPNSPPPTPTGPPYL